MLNAQCVVDSHYCYEQDHFANRFMIRENPSYLKPKNCAPEGIQTQDPWE